MFKVYVRPVGSSEKYRHVVDVDTYSESMDIILDYVNVLRSIGQIPVLSGVEENGVEGFNLTDSHLSLLKTLQPYQFKVTSPLHPEDETNTRMKSIKKFVFDGEKLNLTYCYDTIQF